MKPADVKTCTYINFDVEKAHRNPKFNINDHVRISINKNIFAKGIIPKWSEALKILHHGHVQMKMFL